MGRAPYRPWLGKGPSEADTTLSQVKVMVRGRQHSRTGEVRAVSTGGSGQRAGRAERGGRQRHVPPQGALATSRPAGGEVGAGRARL